MKKLFLLGLVLALYGCGEERPTTQTWDCGAGENGPLMRLDFENLRVQFVYKDGRRPESKQNVEFTDDTVFFDSIIDDIKHGSFSLNFKQETLKINLWQTPEQNVDCKKVNG